LAAFEKLHPPIIAKRFDDAVLIVAVGDLRSAYLGQEDWHLKVDASTKFMTHAFKLLPSGVGVLTKNR
jgi:hypothetical protein